MNQNTWVIATVLSATVVIGFVGLSGYQTSKKLKAANDQNTELRALIEKGNLEITKANETLTEAKERISQLEQEHQQVTANQRNLEQEMRDALQSRDVTISELQGKLTVNILDRVMFDSGEAVLKEEGEAVLLKAAEILKNFPNRQIHVIGHTDNIPIRPAARSRFASNWELSAARATAAVRFLTEKAGVDPKRLGALGYGEFRPVAENNTVDSRAKNRRIALVILPEFSDPDSTQVGTNKTTKAESPPKQPVTSTNEPPKELPPLE